MTLPIPQGLPSPAGNANMRRVFEKDEVVSVTTLKIIPIAQWNNFCFHVEASGGNFTLRARFVDLAGNTYEDNGTPAIDATLHTGGTRVKYTVPASEHDGEAYLQVGLVSPTAAINIQNFDVMGQPSS